MVVTHKDERVASLLSAAQRLRRLGEASEGYSLGQVQTALRSAMAAVEDELMKGEDGVVELEPRLIPAVDRLREDLSALLMQLWEESRAASTETFTLLPRQLDRIADRILDLLHESMTPVGTAG